MRCCSECDRPVLPGASACETHVMSGTYVARAQTRPSNYDLFRTVEQALGALHPRNAEAPKAALREMLNRLNVAHDAFEEQSDRIEQLEKRCA